MYSLTEDKGRLIYIPIGFMTALVLLGYYPFFQINLEWNDFNLTFYSIAMAITFVFFLGRRLIFRPDPGMYNKFYFIFMGVLVLWVIWGLFLYYHGEYVNQLKGKEQLLTVGLGITSVFTVYEACHTRWGFKSISYVVRAVVVGLTIIAIWEMTTNQHLAVSKLSDPEFIAYVQETLKEGYKGKMVDYNASTIFYNVNDFSAFLAIFAPFFFPQKEWSKIWKALALVELAFMIMIMSKNDAWICLLAGVIGVVVYLIVSKAKLKAWLRATVFFVAVKGIGINLFYGIVCLVYIINPVKPIPADILYLFKDGAFGFYSAVSEQMDKAEAGTGSVYTRITTYIDTIKYTFTESYGLGSGPASYTVYMKAHGKETTLINPHCLWTEILFQYGALVLILFVALLIIVLYKLIIKYKATGSNIYLTVIAMDVIFVFACFASSSYLQFQYFWLVIGVSLGMANITDRLSK